MKAITINIGEIYKAINVKRFNGEIWNQMDKWWAAWSDDAEEEEQGINHDDERH